MWGLARGILAIAFVIAVGVVWMASMREGMRTGSIGQRRSAKRVGRASITLAKVGWHCTGKPAGRKRERLQCGE